MDHPLGMCGDMFFSDSTMLKWLLFLATHDKNVGILQAYVHYYYYYHYYYIRNQTRQVGGHHDHLTFPTTTFLGRVRMRARQSQPNRREVRLLAAPHDMETWPWALDGHVFKKGSALNSQPVVVRRVWQTKHCQVDNDKWSDSTAYRYSHHLIERPSRRYHGQTEPARVACSSYPGGSTCHAFHLGGTSSPLPPSLRASVCLFGF